MISQSVLSSFLVAVMAIFATGELVEKSRVKATKPKPASKTTSVNLTIHHIKNPDESGDPEPYIMGQWEYEEAAESFAHVWKSGWSYTDRDGTHNFPSSGSLDGPPTCMSFSTDYFQLNDELILLEADEFNADDVLGKFTVKLGTYPVEGSDGAAEITVTLLNDTNAAEEPSVESLLHLQSVRLETED